LAVRAAGIAEPVVGTAVDTAGAREVVIAAA